MRGSVLAVKPRKFGLDHLKPFGSHEIMRRNGTIGQVVIDLAALGLLGKGLAHGADYITPHAALCGM